MMSYEHNDTEIQPKKFIKITEHIRATKAHNVTISTLWYDGKRVELSVS